MKKINTNVGRVNELSKNMVSSISDHNGQAWVYNMIGKKYLSPELRVELISLENSIAASSATLNPGVDGYIYTPSVDDWTDQGSLGSQDVDL
ncbi:hypothetical protein HZQ04_18470 [Elizabethkingia anophelis]|nr:hypothetical protein [Elizabethkingia anophelis]